MLNRPWSRILAIPFVLLMLSTGCDPDGNGDDPVGALVGQWNLSALTGTYVRDIALPDGWTGPDSFSVDASWDLAPTVLMADSAKADLHLFAFYEGENLLDSTVVFPSPAVLTAFGIEMLAEFTEANTYTLTGTYPTLRLIEAECRTKLVIVPLQDAGSYAVDYLAGTLDILPGTGDQVLPPFNNAPVTFTNNGETLQLDFVDLDAHDSLFAAAGFTWNETELRVTMGVADLPVNADGAFDEFGATLNDTAYIQDAVQLAAWGGFMTFYALTIFGEAECRALDGTITDAVGSPPGFVDDVIGHMAMKNATGITCSGIPYSILVSALGVPTDDSGADFTLAGLATASGGKLKYVVQAVCIPINETNDFKSTWTMVTN